MNALSIERTMWHNNVRHSDIAYVLKAAAVFARAVRSKSSAADQSFPNREAHITQRGWTDLINPLYRRATSWWVGGNIGKCFTTIPDGSSEEKDRVCAQGICNATITRCSKRSLSK